MYADLIKNLGETKYFEEYAFQRGSFSVSEFMKGNSAIYAVKTGNGLLTID
jgi:hypothetical protein